VAPGRVVDARYDLSRASSVYGPLGVVLGGIYAPMTTNWLGGALEREDSILKVSLTATDKLEPSVWARTTAWRHRECMRATVPPMRVGGRCPGLIDLGGAEGKVRT